MRTRTLCVIAAFVTAVALTAWFWQQQARQIEQHFNSKPVDEIGAIIKEDARALIDRQSRLSPPPLTATDEREIEWLATAVYFEARGEPQLGQLMVAKAIMGRVHDPRWPNTVEAVVRQGEAKGRDKCQFSFMCDGRSEEVRNLTAWIKADEAARTVYLLYKQGKLDTSIHSYHAGYAKNIGWFKSLALADRVGQHLFYTDR